MSDSNPEVNSKLVLARWTDRFFAWLIDFIVISTISSAIIFAAFGEIDLEDEGGIFGQGALYMQTSILFFAYWIILEYKTGQTIGKKVLDLKVTDIYGNKPSLKGVIASSFGKAFLLPIDVILGRILTNEKRQRVFSKLGDTVVVKIKSPEDTSNTTYSKD